MSKGKRRFKKPGKGRIFRPCHVCSQTVNFVPWVEESQSRDRKIWHWANEDGSHHVHFEASNEIKHIRAIMCE